MLKFIAPNKPSFCPLLMTFLQYLRCIEWKAAILRSTNDLEDFFPQQFEFSLVQPTLVWFSEYQDSRFFFARKWNIAAIISNLRNIVITQDQTKCKGLQLTLLLIVFALPNCTCLRLSAERCILHRIIHQTKPKHRSETAVYNSWWVPLFFYWKLLGP